VWLGAGWTAPTRANANRTTGLPNSYGFLAGYQLGAITSVSEPGDAKASEIYAAVIDHELEQERERATSLEQRAIAVVTSSGVLVTLVFGFGTLIKGQGGLNFSLTARIILALKII
jgi:hypothetical protein